VGGRRASCVVGCTSVGSRVGRGRGGRWRVGEAVGPAEQGLDECFGFAVGLWAPWSGVAALDAELGAGVAPGEWALAVAVVAEDSLDRDAAFGVPGDGAMEEGDAVGRAFACGQLGVGES
jgi:hypothetical protein